METSATELRQNLYRMLDSVLETGESIEIPRKKGTVRIVAERQATIWDRLEVHDVIRGDVEPSWDDIWDGEPELDDVHPAPGSTPKAGFPQE